jgi:hypothetical protein
VSTIKEQAALRVKNDSAYLSIRFVDGGFSEYLLATIHRIDRHYIAGDINDKPIRVFEKKHDLVIWLQELIEKRLNVSHEMGLKGVEP